MPPRLAAMILGRKMIAIQCSICLFEAQTCTILSICLTIALLLLPSELGKDQIARVKSVPRLIIASGFDRDDFRPGLHRSHPIRLAALTKRFNEVLILLPKPGTVLWRGEAGGSYYCLVVLPYVSLWNSSLEQYSGKVKRVAVTTA